ncbi:hypothetical protein ACSNOI_16320 [Actinomadura kijaniata]|uniref:hypothetical protein n=1 Tax=Actinomadura kijaniata TaxID=46161 RepID=UPI003F1C82AC
MIRNLWSVRWLRPLGFALCVPAAAYLAFSCWALAQSGRGADHDLAAERDELARTAVRQMTMFNSIDPKRADLDMGQWMEEATGPFREVLRRDMTTARARFARQNSPARGQVTALAVTDLDTRAGTATVIASVRVRIGEPGAATPESEQRKRYQVEMRRVAGGWKVNTLTALNPAGPATGGSVP